MLGLRGWAAAKTKLPHSRADLGVKEPMLKVEVARRCWNGPGRQRGETRGAGSCQGGRMARPQGLQAHIALLAWRCLGGRLRREMPLCSGLVTQVGHAGFGETEEYLTQVGWVRFSQEEQGGVRVSDKGWRLGFRQKSGASMQQGWSPFICRASVRPIVVGCPAIVFLQLLPHLRWSLNFLFLGSTRHFLSWGSLGRETVPHVYGLDHIFQAERAPPTGFTEGSLHIVKFTYFKHIV